MCDANSESSYESALREFVFQVRLELIDSQVLNGMRNSTQEDGWIAVGECVSSERTRLEISKLDGHSERVVDICFG